MDSPEGSSSHTNMPDPIFAMQNSSPRHHGHHGTAALTRLSSLP